MENIQQGLPVNESAGQTALIHDTNANDAVRLKIKVSKETFAYLKCLQHLGALHALLEDALETYYDCRTAQRIMDDEYHKKYCAIRDMILLHMSYVIEDNLIPLEV